MHEAAPGSARPGATVLIGWTALAAAGAALLGQWIRAWTVSPGGGFGWLAAVLASYCVLRRWQDRPYPEPAGASPWLWPAIVGALALVFVGRLLLEPFPGWPLAEWAYAAALAGLLFCLVGWWQGFARARHFAFPVVLCLAALPWPALIEVGVIGRLRIALARLAAECSVLAGEPAIAQGTTIRLAHGIIGIEQACGGIRSMQAAVLVALAAGELRRDRAAGRAAWVAAAVALSVLANGIRLTALTLIGGRDGLDALARWHDRADWLEMALVLAGLGILWLAAPRPMASPAEARPARLVPPGPAARILAGAIVAVVACSEASTLWWYGSARSSATAAGTWAAHLPRDLPSYAEDPFTPDMQALLGCDAHELGHWRDASGARRTGAVLEWRFGQRARFALLNHNPDICFPSAGSRLVRSRPPLAIRCGALELPFARREFTGADGPFYLYFLTWDLSTGEPFGEAGETPGANDSWLSLQWREVAARRRRLAVRVVAVAIYDTADPAEADRAFLAEAARILVPGAPPSGG